ncbi:hypothetical protein E4U41_007791 [Claviceps citrina]|nr:hypothetical protein E4U41_007791 [Claviceps citrina]
MATEKRLLYIKTAAPKAPKRRSRAGESPSHLILSSLPRSSWTCNVNEGRVAPFKAAISGEYISMSGYPSLKTARVLNVGSIFALQKKKCDESRPSCTRCREYGQDCHYGPVRPRQRRKVELVRYRGSSLEKTHEMLDSCLGMPPSYADATAQHSDLTLSRFDTINSCVDWDTPQSSFANVDDCQYLGDIPTDPFLTIVGPAGTVSPVLELRVPSFEDFSRDVDERFLMDYFCNTLSHLIVLREEQGNPFQQLVLPLAYNSQAVKGAILALASAHLAAKRGHRLENDEKSIQFHNEAIRNLAKLIEKGHSVNKNELLATIMLTVYYEVLVQRRRSNLVESHLKGAMTIMRNSPSRMDRTSIFLEEAFRFHDVIAALSSGTAPLASENCYSDLDDSPLCRPEQRVSMADGVDALLGLASSLWPVIYRLSGLLALKNRLDDSAARGDVSEVLAVQAKFDAECAVVETSLHEWQPVMPTECAIYDDSNKMTSSAKDKMKELHSIFNNALAYRHSALVYLYRTIYSFPRRQSVVQHHTSVSLAHCKATVLHEGPMGALLWPLFVASCEAISPLDRHSARDTFRAITHRQGMANIDRAWEVVQEVWNRADDADASGTQPPSDGIGMGRKDLWRRVSEDMGVAIVFG